MKQENMAAGMPVRIAEGIYKDAEGVIEDLQPDCSAVRVHTKSGPAYAYPEHLRQVPMPRPAKNPRRAIDKG